MAKEKKTTSGSSRKKKDAGGRPTKFNEDMIRQAEILAVKGFTDVEIGDVFGVTKQTVNNWKKQYPTFFDSLKRGKEIADSVVERCLFERACGYSHPDFHITNYQGCVTKTAIIKHYPPDPTSMIFWLKNRKSKEWRDRIEQDLTSGGEKIQPVIAVMGAAEPERDDDT